MAHVKCKYLKYICMSDRTWCETEGGHSCNFEPMFDRGGLCEMLATDNCYFEKTSKNVVWDGEALFVNGKYIADVGCDEFGPKVDDCIIERLEIDGDVYIPEEEEGQGDMGGEG